MKTEFKKDCRVLSMQREYPGCMDDIKWIIVSDLSETELQAKYWEQVQMFSPYIYMTREMFEPINSAHLNDRKHERRKKTFQFSEIIQKDELEQWKQKMHQENIKSVLEECIACLNIKQRRRIEQFYYEERQVREIAKREGVSEQSIYISIKRGLKAIKRFYEKKGYIGV